MKGVALSWQRILSSVILVCLVILGMTNDMDRMARSELDSSFSSAMKTFVLVRGMNAAISVFQGTEVALEPGGVGVILTPGEVLDPVNDLIERFSWVVLAAGTSIGTQILLLEFGSSSVAKVMLLLAGTTLLVASFTPWLERLGCKNMAVRAALLILFLRFLIPVVTLANETIYNLMLEAAYSESYAALDIVADDVDEFQNEESASIPADTEEGILASINRFYERTAQSMNISARYKAFSQSIEAHADHMIRMIAIYLLQTFVFPLLFLWLAIKGGRALVTASFWTGPTARHPSSPSESY